MVSNVPDCHAQNESGQLTQRDLDAVKADLEPFIDGHLPRVSKEFKEGRVLFLSSLFDYQLPDTNQLNKATENLIKARIDKANKDIGLGLRADYLQNAEKGIADAQSGGFYRRRGMVGVEWDLLGNGLVDGNYKAKMLEQELRLNQMLHENNAKDQAFNHLFNTIIFTFNKVKIQKLKNRKQIVQRQVDLEKKLFKNDLVLWDQVIESLSRKRETENMLKNLENYNNSVGRPEKPVNPELLPVVDIDINKVLTDIREEGKIDSILKVQKWMLDYKNHPVRDISLSPYMRYNIYNNPDGYVNDDGSRTDNRQFFSFGLSFSTPIQFDWDEKQNLKEAKLKQLRARQKEEMQTKVKEALNFYYEYQYALNQYIKFYHKRARLLEKIRQEKAKKQIGENIYSPVRILELMDNLSAVNFELFDIHQKMYLKLLNIYTYLDEYDIRDVVTPINLKEQVRNLETTRSLYIWSEAFGATSNPQLVDFLKGQEIKNVMLSLGPQDTMAKKARSFILQARDKDIQTHIMIGNNRLFFSDRKHEIDKFISSAAKLNAAGVHLDVEPHVLESWKQNEDEYLKKFIDMVEYTSKQAGQKDLKLSVSIPLFYEKNISKSIYPYCDKVFIMAYKQKDLRYLRNKLMKELEVDQEKTVIALRPEDFQNLEDFNTFIDQLKQRTRINEFAIHDLRELQKMEKAGSD